MAFCFSLFNSSDTSMHAISLIRAQTFGRSAKAADRSGPGGALTARAQASRSKISYDVNGRRVKTKPAQNWFKASSQLELIKKKLKKAVTIETLPTQSK